MIVRVEKLQALTSVSPNGTIVVDPSGSELWFYCVDPTTETIVGTNHSRINRQSFSFLKLSYNDWIIDFVISLVQHRFGNGIDESPGLPHGDKTEIGRLRNPTAVGQSLGVKTVRFRYSGQPSVERFSCRSRGRRGAGLFACPWRHRLHLRLVGQVCGIRFLSPNVNGHSFSKRFSSRLQSNTDKRVQPYVVFPPYNPVVIDPNPKEYETQVRCN